MKKLSIINIMLKLFEKMRNHFPEQTTFKPIGHRVSNNFQHILPHDDRTTF